MTISGDRVRQAREFAGLTQAGLAERIGLTQAAISQLETGQKQPSDEVATRIAFATGFPIGFFTQIESFDFPLGSLIFRARTSLTATERSRAHRLAQVAFEVAAKLAQRVHQLTVRLPTKTEDPTSAATLARSGMGLSPDTPIPHLTNVLERNGVLILALPTSIAALDAFSSWAGQDPRWPVIAFVSGKLGDRLRFSIAHELGHLVMHQSPRGSFAELERDANRFAAEFLLPDQAMRQEITTPITLSSLTKLKRRWLVSTQVLIRRAYDLEIATERQYRYLMQQLSHRGWRIREPEEFDIPIEKPRLLLKMAEVLYGWPRPDYAKMASDMKLSVPIVRSILNLYQSRGALSQRVHDGAKRVGKVIPIFGQNERNS